VAADATRACLMGFEPSRIVHIHEGNRFLGNACSACIDQAGEPMVARATPFHVVQNFTTFAHRGGNAEMSVLSDKIQLNRPSELAFAAARAQLK